MTKIKKETWLKYHSCCDWFYKNKKTGQTTYFCGLSRDENGKFNREDLMKEFEKNKIIVYD